MADMNEFNSNAGDVVTGVEVVKKSKTGLIVGGLAVLTAGAVAVVAGGGVAAYCFSDFVKNQVKLRVSSPENYYAWVYEKNADAAAKQISTAYAKSLDKIEAGQKTSISLRYDLTDESRDVIIDELDLDRNSKDEERSIVEKLDNITIGADGSAKDSLLSGKAYIDWNDDRLVTADIATDNSTMDYFVRIPELTDKWLAVEAGKLIEENSYGSTENEVIDVYKKAAQDPRSVISPEEIEELANRYIKVWNESVDDVKLEKKQTVTINDIGTVDEIRRWCSTLGSELIMNENTELHSQFRCNGSDEFIQFVDLLLQKKQGTLPQELHFDFQIFPDPSSLREELRKKNAENNRSRMVAGYCYDWNLKYNRRGFKYDIYLPGFEAKWNLADDDIWAINPNSFEEVGCIHTAQGLEFEYVGVLIGKDLRYDKSTKTIITDKTAISKDDRSSGIRTANDDDARRLILNTYKTLMTRGMKGCFVYCEDDALREYFESMKAIVQS